MIAYCGLDCSACEAFIATRENDDTKRAAVAEKWTVTYNTEMTKDQINCQGCKSTGKRFFFSENRCEIRKCNIEKSNANCAECSDYKCQKLEEIIAMAPQVGVALESLR